MIKNIIVSITGHSNIQPSIRRSSSSRSRKRRSSRSLHYDHFSEQLSLLFIVLIVVFVIPIQFCYATIPFWKSSSRLFHRTARTQPIERSYSCDKILQWRGGAANGGGGWYRGGSTSRSTTVNRDDTVVVVDDNTSKNSTSAETGIELMNKYENNHRIMMEQNEPEYYLKKESSLSIPPRSPMQQSTTNLSNSVSYYPSNTSSSSSSSSFNPSSVNKSSSWRSTLPVSLQKKGSKIFQKITFNNCIIYLLGTSHVSNDSSNDVTTLLHHVQPDCIFIELCEGRMQLLYPTSSTSSTSNQTKNTTTTTGNNASSAGKRNKKPPLSERIKKTQSVEGGSRLQALSSVLLSSVQEDYAESLGVELGGEFRCAHSYWQQRIRPSPDNPITTVTSTNQPDVTNRNCYLILGDRPVQVTLIRAWESLNIFTKLKVVVGLIYSSLRKPNRDELQRWITSIMEQEGSDVLTESMNELRYHFPTLYTTIIEERDLWLAAKLVQTVRVITSLHKQQQQHLRNQYLSNRDSLISSTEQQQNQRPNVIVAIVGAGHVPGICQHLTNSTNNTEGPEDILQKLVTTRRWDKDPVVQNEIIPSWINDIIQVHDNQQYTNNNLFKK